MWMWCKRVLCETRENEVRINEAVNELSTKVHWEKAYSREVASKPINKLPFIAPQIKMQSIETKIPRFKKRLLNSAHPVGANQIYINYLLFRYMERRRRKVYYNNFNVRTVQYLSAIQKYHYCYAGAQQICPRITFCRKIYLVEKPDVFFLWQPQAEKNNVVVHSLTQTSFVLKQQHSHAANNIVSV